ncbi:SRPBCC domain-containing protein [bacterium]|nr:SRPBCC domain-containing protein [bacterium]
MSATTKQVYRVMIEAPVEKVWEVLTQSGRPLPFFFGSVLHTTSLGPGAPIRMRTPDGKNTGVVGEVLEFDPPRRYAHTFKFTSENDPLCRVTYELEPVDGGTRFTLTSEEVPVGTKTEKYMGQGTEFICNTLKSLVETGQPNLKQKFFLFMMKCTSFMTPRQSRSENWPLDKAIT